MSRASWSTAAHDDEELRDPTREELFNGPTREKLPVEIQQMPQDETACTFCGVSYFVFSEVQELQTTVKKYKRTFHEFVRFMERERRVSQEIRAQVQTLKKSFDDEAAAFAATVQRLSVENQQLRRNDEQLTSELQLARRDISSKQMELIQSQSQFRLAEEEWRLASALTDQKLRNEILHLSSELEKCRLLTSSQETAFAADMERERGKIRQLELLVEVTRESMTSAERQLLTERDVLKQQLLAANELVEAKRDVAKQLENQLRAVQQELQRVLASYESERTEIARLNSDIAALKLQLQQMEKTKATLSSECADLKDELNKSNEISRSLRAEIATLEKRIDVNVRDTEKCKLEFARELEKIRAEHGHAINRMQREHQKNVEELERQQQSYIEYLQKQTNEAAALSTSTLQQALIDTESKLHDAEKLVSNLKRQALETTDEVQQLRRSQQDAKAQQQTLKRQLDETESERAELTEEVEHLQRQCDELKASIANQVGRAEADTKARLQQEFEDQRVVMQRRLDGLQSKYDQLRREKEQFAKHHAQAGRIKCHPEDDSDEDSRPLSQQAWGVGDGIPRTAKELKRERSPHLGGNQDQHDLEKVVESLRRTIEHKDKEIALLQQTVHRECLERTSLLEKMRSGKVLPDLVPSVSSRCSGTIDASFSGSVSTTRPESMGTNVTDAQDREDRDIPEVDPNQPKASLYERLRRAGQRKSKARK